MLAVDVTHPHSAHWGGDVAGGGGGGGGGGVGGVPDVKNCWCISECSAHSACIRIRFSGNLGDLRYLRTKQLRSSSIQDESNLLVIILASYLTKNTIEFKCFDIYLCFAKLNKIFHSNYKKKKENERGALA